MVKELKSGPIAWNVFPQQCKDGLPPIDTGGKFELLCGCTGYIPEQIDKFQFDSVPFNTTECQKNHHNRNFLYTVPQKSE